MIEDRQKLPCNLEALAVLISALSRYRNPPAGFLALGS